MLLFKQRIFPLCMILLLSFPTFSFSGCEESGTDSLLASDMYLSYLQKNDFGSCYSMLASGMPEDLTQTAFIERHTRIYDAIQLTGISWKNISHEQDGLSTAIAVYDIYYSSSVMEAFTVRITIPLVYEQLYWKIDWSPSLFFPEMGWEDQVKVSTLYPKRGEILDSEANLYAVNTYGDTVFVNTSTVQNVSETSTSLASLLRMDAAEIRKNIITTQQKGQDIAIIKTYLPGTIDSSLSDLLVQIQGVGIDSTTFSPMRYYPQGAAAAHLVGYTSPISEEDLAGKDPARYNADSRVGVAGLEAAYEKEMTGYRGFDISIYHANGERTCVVRQDAIDGLDLELTLDYELQMRAASLLNMLEEGQAGVIIAIDPKTGDLLAAANGPSFDPNDFTFPITDYDARFNDPAKNSPLYPRYTMGTYPPGSTVKPLVAGMALELGILTTNFEFTQHIDWKKKQWTPTAYGEWYYPPITRVSNYSGPVNMENAIIQSDNIYFAYTALQSGWDKLKTFFDSCGFDVPLPFDMNVVKPHIVSPGDETNLHQLASTGFGQGKFTVSPIQMAYVFSVFANNGSIMQPRLVKSLRGMEDNQYKIMRSTQNSVWRENIFQKSTIDTLNAMLRKVITEGSGREGRLDDIITLGKTGTAELDDNKQREIAWSINFVQSDDYSRLVCVMLEVPAKQGDFRHRCVREMLLP